MPGIHYFMDSNLNVEGDLLGTLVFGNPADLTELTDITPMTGTTNGTWIEVKKYDKIALGIIASAAATVEIRGSMAVAKPATSYDGYRLFSALEVPAFTTAGEIIVGIKTPLRWLKVKVTANSGNLMAPFIGV